MIYAITGGTKGIGRSTADILRGQGHEVVVIDIDGGDINGDIGNKTDRERIIREIHERYPNGIDGLVANAGIAFAQNASISYVLRVNYFGAIEIIQGLFDLLEKKRGTVAVTVSGSIGYTHAGRPRYYIDDLLTNCGDEERICKFVDDYDAALITGVLYPSSKRALARWVRRISASWATRGVIINAVAPGGVDTTIIPNMKSNREQFELNTLSMPMPAIYYAEDLMQPSDIGGTLAFMVTPAARGNCGAIIYCDSGCVALLSTERL